MQWEEGGGEETCVLLRGTRTALSAFSVHRDPGSVGQLQTAPEGPGAGPAFLTGAQGSWAAHPGLPVALNSEAGEWRFSAQLHVGII